MQKVFSWLNSHRLSRPAAHISDFEEGRAASTCSALLTRPDICAFFRNFIASKALARKETGADGIIGETGGIAGVGGGIGEAIGAGGATGGDGVGVDGVTGSGTGVAVGACVDGISTLSGFTSFVACSGACTSVSWVGP